MEQLNNYVIVVEGKNDKALLKTIYPDIEVITTSGSVIPETTLEYISGLESTHRIILLMDPDYPGERIRNIIKSRVKNVSEAFVDKKDAISKNKRKVGIEHCSRTVIVKALGNLLTYDSAKKSALISFNDLVDFHLTGHPDSKVLRESISRKLNIGKPNAKVFLKRLNIKNISISELENIVEEAYEDINSSSNGR